MKIALAAINPVIGDFTANTGQIEEKISRAAEAGCELLILPELALSGSPPMDLLRRPLFIEGQDRALARLLAGTVDIPVLCGVISRDSSAGGGALYNSAVLFEGGTIQFLIHKHVPDRFGSYRENDYFEAGEVFPPVPFRGLRLGITLGREILPGEQEGAHNPVAEFHRSGGADLFINLAAVPFNLDDASARLAGLGAVCRSYQTPLLHVNQLGGQDSLLFDGRCLAFNDKGDIDHCTAAFEEGLLIVDNERLNRAGSRRDGREDRDLDAVVRGLVTGIRDYVLKAGFCKVVVGLSGGIDSALTCALAVRALGPENVLGVAMPSAISSPESLDDARRLAENLGIALQVIPIKETFGSLKNTLAPAFQGSREDLTEANLQARIRGDILMALANKFGRLLLATGNKSEVSAGYCTLYGDTCGALAPLADVPKTMVYRLAALLNESCGSREKAIIPESVMTKAPSAELIPGRKDQDDLPPYGIMDEIIEYRLRDGLSVAEIISRGYDPVTVRDVLRRLAQNEYKRRQLPPALWITSPDFVSGTGEPLTAGFQEEYD